LPAHVEHRRWGAACQQTLQLAGSDEDVGTGSTHFSSPVASLAMETILPPKLTDVTGHAFDEPDRRAVYRAISERRDMREFVSENGWHSPARPPAAVVGLPACPR